MYGNTMIIKIIIISYCALTLTAVGSAFMVVTHQMHNVHHRFTKGRFRREDDSSRSFYIRPELILEASSRKESNDRKESKRGYQFGDFTKSIVNKVTGKDEYQFGDLSRWLDLQAKRKVNELTDKNEYEFGDLSRWIDARVKENVNAFTGSEDYQFGDVTKEIAKRVANRNYDLSEIVILCKALLSFGVGLSPVSGLLPVKLLVDMINFSIMTDVNEKLIGALTLELDRRMKQAMVGDPDYALGDLTKKAILNFIDKEKYTFGDISKKVFNSLEDKDKPLEKVELFSGTNSKVIDIGSGESPGDKSTSDIALPLMDSEIIKELEEWDKLREAKEDSNQSDG